MKVKKVAKVFNELSFRKMYGYRGVFLQFHELGKEESWVLFTYVRRLVLMKWKLMFRIHSSRGVFMRLVNGQKIGCPSRMHECWSPLKINEDYILTWCPIHPSLLDETSNGELPKRKNKIKEFWMMDHPDFFFFFWIRCLSNGPPLRI